MSATAGDDRRRRSRTYTPSNIDHMQLQKHNTSHAIHYENYSPDVFRNDASHQSRIEHENVPEIPPKQNKRIMSLKERHLQKSFSVGTNRLNHPDDQDEELYISHDEIETFPTNTQRHEESTKQKHSHLGRTDHRITIQLHERQPRSPVRQAKPDLPVYAGVNKQKKAGSPRKGHSPEIQDERLHDYINFEFPPKTTGDTSPVVLQEQPNHTRPTDLLLQLKKIRSRAAKLYNRIQETENNSTELTELKAFLGLNEVSTVDHVLESVHASLGAEALSGKVDDRDIYIVDFCNFKDKLDLRKHLIDMFAKPGPPSVSYQDVDAKMNSVITEFSSLVEELRNTRNEAIQSPAHARTIMKGFTMDCEGLVRTLADNKLWVRWGTPTYLPPLSHLYMHKHPPNYETRKAVTISYIAERKRMVPQLFGQVPTVESLCPPIYGRLKCERTNEIKWQVTDYNESSRKFETRECSLPFWLEDDNPAKAVLHSSNRSSFTKGDHPYALYTVYLVIIKDFTINDDAELYATGKHNWATPSKYQLYIGSSSTGVMFKFQHGDYSHCHRTRTVLQEAADLRHFRCYQGCDLIEANLALSWIRQQPRAIFVLNSFLAQSMSSLSLQKKKPFHDKMLALHGHLAEGRKLGGDLFDMRFGMNGLSTIPTDE